MGGQQFAGEMQIFHLHVGRARLPVYASLIEVQEFGFNYYFDAALQAFEYQYEVDAAMCASKQRRERRRVSKIHR